MAWCSGRIVVMLTRSAGPVCADGVGTSLCDYVEANLASGVCILVCLVATGLTVAGS